MPIYKVPVVWLVDAYVESKATSPMQAKDKIIQAIENKERVIIVPFTPTPRENSMQVRYLGDVIKME